MDSAHTLNQGKKGFIAETQAQVFLEKQGLKLVCRNWRCQGGEIDLIMQDQKTWVFVEVKMRKNAAFGGALASITPQKCQKLFHAASLYLLQNKINAPCRFDAVLIEGDQPPLWIKNIIT